jgi:hypothetical protein
MTNDQALILSLKIKTSSHSGAFRKIDPDDAIDFLHVMISKEQVYKCRDYLGRRGTNVVQRDIFFELGLECAPLEIDDIIDITSREKMCEWTYRVCDFFNMNREMVALSFSFLDRFLDRCTCDRAVFKLASMTTLFMATKVFNAKQISLSSLSELSRGEFEMSHLAEMERIILQALDWRLNPPTIQSFIGYLLALLPLDDARLARWISMRAIFLAELCCFDYCLVTQDRSLIAVSCILNALDGMDDDDVDVSRDLRRDFLETIRSKLSLEFEGEEMETSQGRLLYLYNCSAQVKEDKILPLRVSKERLVKQISQNNLSPVSVSYGSDLGAEKDASRLLGHAHESKDRHRLERGSVIIIL